MVLAFRAGADLVELRLDGIDSEIAFDELLADRAGEVVVTCRRRGDGGAWDGDEARRRELLIGAQTSGADWVDVEADVAAQLPREGGARRVVSVHDLDGTPTDLAGLFGRLRALTEAGAGDCVKVAARARGWLDVLRMVDAAAACRRPTIAISMGEIGQITRLLAGRFGAPWTYAALDFGPIAAPGQLRMRELREVFAVARIGPATRLFAVIGDPIDHSLSPAVHNAAFAALGVDAAYLRLRVPSPDLAGLPRRLGGHGFAGFSVTAPHKIAVLDQADGVDAVARACGAANTLVLRDDPDAVRWWATNTDLPAAMGLIADAAGGIDRLRGKRALVLGAGGVARTLAYGLGAAGVHVTIASRTVDRARSLAAAARAEFVRWRQRGDVRADVLVNATPVGLDPSARTSLMPRASLMPGQIVFDAVYAPTPTRLLLDARLRGALPISGERFFVEQAALQCELFAGEPAPRDVIEAAAVNALSEHLEQQDAS